MQVLVQETEERFGLVAIFVGAALAFGAGIWATLGSSKALEYFAGYLLEQSLSVDNLFVFVLVFDYFKTDTDGQEKVCSCIWYPPVAFPSQKHPTLHGCILQSPQVTYVADVAGNLSFIIVMQGVITNAIKHLACGRADTNGQCIAVLVARQCLQMCECQRHYQCLLATYRTKCHAPHCSPHQDQIAGCLGHGACMPACCHHTRLTMHGIAGMQVLTYGIASAAVLRLIMVLLGAELIDRFQPVLLGFALLLLFSSWRLLIRKPGDEEEDLSQNNIVRLCRCLVLVLCSHSACIQLKCVLLSRSWRFSEADMQVLQLTCRLAQVSRTCAYGISEAE